MLKSISAYRHHQFSSLSVRTGDGDMPKLILTFQILIVQQCGFNIDRSYMLSSCYIIHSRFQFMQNRLVKFSAALALILFNIEFHIMKLIRQFQCSFFVYLIKTLLITSNCKHILYPSPYFIYSTLSSCFEQIELKCSFIFITFAMFVSWKNICFNLIDSKLSKFFTRIYCKSFD